MYLRILENIAEIAQRSGRDPSAITLVAVSKGYSWTQVQTAYSEGCRDFGESRLQEAFAKKVEAPTDIRWHLIGSLQKNKVRKVVGAFSLIHSVDTLEIAEKISECSHEAQLVTPILLQVNTSGEATKHGLTQKEWKRSLESILALPAIRIEGLMTMAPLVEDKKIIRACFADLRRMRDLLAPQFVPRHPFQHLSMGMSHDYPIAIEEGATLLRIGTALWRGVNKSCTH